MEVIKNKIEVILASIVLISFFLPWNAMDSGYYYFCCMPSVTWPAAIPALFACILMYIIFSFNTKMTIIATNVITGAWAMSPFFLLLSTNDSHLFKDIRYGFIIMTITGLAFFPLSLYRFADRKNP